MADGFHAQPLWIGVGRDMVREHAQCDVTPMISLVDWAIGDARRVINGRRRATDQRHAWCA